MICMILSAALYNAAMVRTPKNKKLFQKILNDLKSLCTMILRKAGAKQQTSDLVEQSKRVKIAIESMRSKVNEQLSTIDPTPDYVSKIQRYNLEIHKIESITNLQNQIFKSYKQAMTDLAGYCHHVMGNFPWRFAFVGMGSLARKEITPYSDFENIIILENANWNQLKETEQDAILNYFRWFAVIFQTVLINLKETILPSVAVPSLNNFYSENRNDNWFYDAVTTRGVCFDGMMPQASKSPLGRRQHTKNKPWTTELIKPVEKMLEYLTRTESLKNGYKLHDILTKTCFVYGDEAIYDDFRRGVIEIQENENQEDKTQSVKNQINEDMDAFATKFTFLQVRDKINIKRIAYRSTTIFIAALGRLFNIQAQSCFDMIEELRQNNELSDYAAHKLMFSVSVACEIRLKWYSHNNSQTDEVIATAQQTAMEIFTNLIGKLSMISYFQVAYALQCDISKRLHLKRLHFHANPNLFNLSLIHCLNDVMKTYPFVPLQQITTDTTIRLFSLDHCLTQLENDEILKISFRADQPLRSSNSMDLFGYNRKMGEYLLERNCFDAALEYHLRALDNLVGNVEQGPYSTNICNLAKSHLEALSKNVESQLLHPQNCLQLSSTLLDTGSCLLYLNEPTKALQYLHKTLFLVEKNSSDIETDGNFANVMHEFGRCLVDLNKPIEALQYFNRALQIKEKISSDIETDRNFATTLHKLGSCSLDLNKPFEALQCFITVLRIEEKCSSKIDIDRDFAVTLHFIGRCLVSLNKPSEALQYHERALQIKEKSSSDVDTDKDLAIISQSVSRCLLDLKKPNEALRHCNRALQIKENTSIDIDADRSIANALHGLGRCLMNLNKVIEAFQCYNKGLQIIEKTSDDIGTDRNYAVSLQSIGRCLLNLNKQAEALQSFTRSLEIIKRISFNTDADSPDIDCANASHEIGRCLLKLNKPSEALQYFDKALQIDEKTSSDIDFDRNFAVSLHGKGRCLLSLGEPTNALTILTKSLQVWRRISANMSYVVDTITKNYDLIALCLFKLKKFAEALQCIKKSLSITQDTDVDAHSDLMFADTLHEIHVCLLNSNKLEEADLYLNRSKLIRQRTLFNSKHS